MKKVYSLLVVSLCILTSTTIKVSAQFADAFQPEEVTGLSPVQAVNTGSAIMDISGTDYIVNVWDDNMGPNAAISWKVGTASGWDFIDQNSTVVDPDVCIIRNGIGNTYALVAYYDNNSSYFMLRVFQWNGSLQTFVAQNPIQVEGGQYGNTVNIDASDNSDFAMVWDQPGNLIQMAIGRASGGTAPTLTFPGVNFNLEDGTMPDVSIYRDVNNNFKQVDVVYINLAGEVLVDFYSFAQLLTGNQNFVPYFRSGAPDLEFRYPRIDTPAGFSGMQNDFTVVAEDSDNSSTWYIKGMNSHSCCPGFTYYTYNDGSTGNSPWNLTSVPNTRPVVAYHKDLVGVTVGWNFDNSFGLLAAPGASIAEFPIVMSLDKRARIFPAAYYLNVPSGVTFGSASANISVAGRHSPNGVFSYLNKNSQEVYFKVIADTENMQNLRTENPTTNFYEWLNNFIADDNGTSLLNVEIFDLQGKSVFAYSGDADKFSPDITKNFQNQSTGIYVIKAFSDTDAFSGKLVLGY